MIVRETKMVTIGYDVLKDEDTYILREQLNDALSKQNYPEIDEFLFVEPKIYITMYIPLDIDSKKVDKFIYLFLKDRELVS